MNIEQKLNYYLNRHPIIKRIVKKIYQRIMYYLSSKIKCEGNIKRVSPNDKYDYFFGYYDKSPWDASMRYMICMRAKNTWSDPEPNDIADILLIDTKNNYKIKKIASTLTWNVQQGCNAQWLGPDFKSQIIYNDLRNGRFCSVIINIKSNEEKILPMPVYAVSNDGKTALSLDFSRLHNLRLGYGYSALPEKTKGIPLPNSTAIWKLDLTIGKVKELLTYTDFASFQLRPEMLKKNSIHKVNHLMISPNGKRFMVLYRWFNGKRKYTRLITCNIDGSDMYVLSDDDMVSHCFWKNDEEIIAFIRKNGIGDGYFLLKDKSKEYIHLWSNIKDDGHPSYCPTDNSLVITDSYPNRARVAVIKLLYDNDLEGRYMKVIARVFAPFKYDNETRCDLHPRWSRDGKFICFDGAFEGFRRLYIVPININKI